MPGTDRSRPNTSSNRSTVLRTPGNAGVTPPGRRRQGVVLGRIPLLSLFIAMSSSACAETVVVDRPVPAAVRAEVERRSSGGASVRTSTGVLSGEGLRFSGDSLVSRTFVVPMEDLDAVSIKSRSAGFTEGLVWGAGVAAGLGLLSATTSDPDRTLLFESRAGVGLFVAVVSSLFTIPAGGLIGVGLGKTTDFVFRLR